MFVLLFVYVFGGAIATPGYDYVDFLIPGIIVQNIAFGGFVTALGLNEDLNKGLIDRFRSLPMARSAVLAGRTLADVVTNFAVDRSCCSRPGLIIGFSLRRDAPARSCAGVVLLLLFGYAFSWVFALLGLLVSSPEAANSVGFIAVFPLTFISSAFVPVESMPARAAVVRRDQPVHDRGRRDARAVARRAGRELVWAAFVWSAVIFAIFAPLAVRATARRRAAADPGFVGGGPAARAPRLSRASRRRRGRARARPRPPCSARGR